MKKRENIILPIVCAVIGVMLCAGAFFAIASRNEVEKTNIVKDGAASFVPAKNELTANLANSEYTIEEFTDIYGLNVTGERVYAENGGKYIDICYNLSTKDAKTVYAYFEEKYENADYYILARNDTFVYCVSDKQTFSKSGFKGIDNVGEQHIRE